MAQYHNTEQQIVTDLASWRTTTDPVVMPVALAGQNSQIFNPAFDVNGRATVTMPNGRFGQVTGVPDSVVVGGTL